MVASGFVLQFTLLLAKNIEHLHHPGADFLERSKGRGSAALYRRVKPHVPDQEEE